jgi:hypothetical protein
MCEVLSKLVEGLEVWKLNVKSVVKLNCADFKRYVRKTVEEVSGTLIKPLSKTLV